MENEKRKRNRSRDSSSIKEVKPKKKKRSKKYLLLYVAIFGFVIYSAITIINQNIEIKKKKEELALLNEQLSIVEIDNELLEKVKNYDGDELSEYIENIAREDLDYIKNGERVFINVSGD